MIFASLLWFVADAMQDKYLFKTLGKGMRIWNWLVLESSTYVHLTFGAR